MRKQLLFILQFLILSVSLGANNLSVPESGIIRLYFQVDKSFPNDSIEIETYPILNITGFVPSTQRKIKLVNGWAACIINSNEPLYVRAGNLTKHGKEIISSYLIEPGDSLTIQMIGDELSFSGIGTEKFELQKKIKELEMAVIGKPSTSMFSIGSVTEYYEWNNYLDAKTKAILRVIDLMKNELSASAWLQMRVAFLSNIQYGKCHIWNGLLYTYFNKLGRNLSMEVRQELSGYFEKSFYSPVLIWLRSQPVSSAGNMDFVRIKFARDCLFSEKKKQALDIADSNKANIDYCKLLFEDVFQIYTGRARESCLASLMCYLVIHNGALEQGFPPEYDKFLDKYYTGPYSSEFKGYVKKYEKKDRLQGLYNGYKINSHFSLPDENGKTHDYALLKGKIAFIGFWENDNTMNDFETIYSRFKGNSNIVFLNISVDKNKNTWLNNIQKYKYYRPGIINLYTDGLGKEHPAIKALLIDNFPQVAILSASGRVFKKENNGELVDGIEREISKLYDGPYIFTIDAEKKYYVIRGVSVLTGNIDENAPLTVATDRYNKTFPLKLKQSYNIVSSVYEQPEKIIALSDIEGNFDAFRKLLQTNKVIDERLNWIFGSGHLVFAGDMFDRGEQVTECLWLIYSLEEKAKAAGGYVHFVLGNHEIMNLQGNHSYTKEKYHNNAKLIGKRVTELYNEDSELGRWLRTKNIIEKIGNLLFLHGGISPEVNRLPLTLQQINDLARPYYAGGIDSTNKNLMTLYDTRKGERYYISPFWSRGYYREKGKLSDEQLDSTLQKFNVSRIITGHTVVADTISVHYGGKVINTDTRHAEGKSEALLIEGDYYYRVNQEGNRVLLFIDDKKKTSPSAQ